METPRPRVPTFASRADNTMRVFAWLTSRFRAVLGRFGCDIRSDDVEQRQDPFVSIYEQLRIESERVVLEETAGGGN
jgi:hypothetical protein